ncbi:MAG: hypothetical protein K1X85_07415 [Ignavibacteria bacterium]|nr:hypothetical protein [Ignavibacteria bacterium]
MFIVISVAGCSSSKKVAERNVNESVSEEYASEEYYSILELAKSEQLKPMYEIDADTTLLYWLGDLPLELTGYTKCNVFALNVLMKARFMTPSENCTTAELFDPLLYSDILPVVSANLIGKARPGDLIVWQGHVIIFERHILLNGTDYALGWWAGTRQEDNGDNIINNVCHGKYKLEGEYIVRRPVKKPG